MTDPISCITCNQPADPTFVGIQKWSRGMNFCSKNCQDRHLRKLIGYASGFLIILSVLLIFAGVSTIGFLFFVLGWVILVYGFYYQGMRAQRRQLDIQKIRSIPDLGNDPKDKKFYSSILQTSVYPCCHQSARLNDKYCACGRVIEYPS
ncbi:MAG: DUF2721 domain-containing protein [Candidatus Heimdallarchaeota archaeon]|nr:DUF2721 domain-containing protein [Candidatus Heimdallarchaeota archaeon]